jgi:lipopolysaccharide export system protein LptC
VSEGGQAAAAAFGSYMVDFAVRIDQDRPPYDGERARAFDAAARHSALVRFLRVTILGGAVGSVALLVAIGVFDPFGRLAHDVSFSGLALDGAKVLMNKPKLAGFRKDGRPYLVNAQEAIQDVLHPTLVDLRAIDAEIGMAGNGVAHIIADKGHYDTANERMDVEGNVLVKSDQYDARLRSGSMDFKSGVYVSKEPVTVIIRDGSTVTADTMSAIDNGHQLSFEGRVRTFLPASETAPTPSNGQLKGTGP